MKTTHTVVINNKTVKFSEEIFRNFALENMNRLKQVIELYNRYKNKEWKIYLDNGEAITFTFDLCSLLRAVGINVDKLKEWLSTKKTDDSFLSEYLTTRHEQILAGIVSEKISLDDLFSKNYKFIVDDLTLMKDINLGNIKFICKYNKKRNSSENTSGTSNLHLDISYLIGINHKNNNGFTICALGESEDRCHYPLRSILFFSPRIAFTRNQVFVLPSGMTITDSSEDYFIQLGYTNEQKGKMIKKTNEIAVHNNAILDMYDSYADLDTRCHDLQGKIDDRDDYTCDLLDRLMSLEEENKTLKLTQSPIKRLWRDITKKPR